MTVWFADALPERSANSFQHNVACGQAEIAGLELPPHAKADIAWPGSCNEPGACLPLQRIFDANYPVNLTRDPASGNWSFVDIIGATTTNVYRLGCYTHDHNCTAVTDSKSPGTCAPLPERAVALSGYRCRSSGSLKADRSS